MRMTLTGTKAEMIAHLTAEADSLDGQAKIAAKGDAKVRLAGRAEGLRDAIRALGMWQIESPDDEGKPGDQGGAESRDAPW